MPGRGQLKNVQVQTKGRASEMWQLICNHWGQIALLILIACIDACIECDHAHTEPVPMRV